TGGADLQVGRWPREKGSNFAPAAGKGATMRCEHAGGTDDPDVHAIHGTARRGGRRPDRGGNGPGADSELARPPDAIGLEHTLAAHACATRRSGQRRSAVPRFGASPATG